MTREFDDVEWFKAKACETGGCIEIGDFLIGLSIRAPQFGPNYNTLAVTYDEFDAFVAGVKAGDFDHLLNQKER